MKTIILIFLACLPLGAQITVGGAYQLSATCVYPNNVTEKCNTKDANGDMVSWTSTVPAIATVNVAGLATGIKPGTTQLYAMSGKIKSNILSLIVAVPITLTSVSASVKTGNTIVHGKTAQMEATCIYSDKSRLNCNKTDVHGDVVSHWQITASTVSTAGIDSMGVVTGIAKGTVSIKALVNTMASNTVTITIQ